MKKLKTVLSITAVLVIFLAPSSLLAQNAPKLSDAEIASVAVTANQGDIGFAKIAKQKSKNEDVLKFAETMARDHQAVIDQAVALVTKLKVTPKDNAVSRKLVADAGKTRKMLLSKSSKTFNKAYINNEVAYHKAVISAVETLLIPQATNQDLKDLLQNVMPTLKAHLEHAEMVQHMFAAK